jgi:CIC family chloride channel protein
VGGNPNETSSGPSEQADPSEPEAGAPLAAPRAWLAFAAGLAAAALGAALFAIAFRWTMEGALRWLYGARDILSSFRAVPMPARLLLPCAGGLLAGSMGIVAARFGSGYGVGDVMESVVLGRGRISLRVTLSKALGCWFAIVGGGSIGREGPIIQFGGGFAGAIANFLRIPPERARALIAAGTAAGFAAAYNTPFAAVLFVVEIVAGFAALDVLLPVIVATPIATAATRFAIGGGPIYGVQTFSMVSQSELGLHAILGILAGACGAGFMGMLHRGEELFGRLRLSLPLRAAAGGLIVGFLALPLPEVTGNGYEAINLVLGGKLGWAMMLVLLVAKPFATTASVSSGSPGGVFTPSLFLGSVLGGLLGIAFESWWGASVGPPGAYALVGMAAVSAATTHAPLMAAVMVFELSGDYAIVLPLLVATALATAVSRRLRRDSIYAAELRRRGVAWEITLEGRRMTPVTSPSEGASRGSE